MQGLRIGITIGLQSASESLWNNGIKQNAMHLLQTLRHCAQVASVVLVNTTAVELSSVAWNTQRWPTMAINDAKDQLDVLIELGGQVSPELTQYLKQKGCRLVSYCCGSEYFTAIESIVFGRRMWDQLFINPWYDDIWVVPQVANTSQSFFEVLRRQQARVVPFVWDPSVLQERSIHLPHQGLYAPGRARKRLSVIEPNINVVKCCLYPVLIAEMLYRSHPEQIDMLQVTNAQDLATSNHDFISLMNQLDIVRQHKAVFWGRFETPVLLAQHTDMVLSHQLENALNYLYLEVCWQGYPLIHNAHLCAELGYYYPGHDMHLAHQAATQALLQHDDHYVRYRVQQRALIERFLTSNRRVHQHYSALLHDLVNRPLRMP